MTKALVSSVNMYAYSHSLQKLFGDPDQYAYKFANDSFADKLPIYLNWFYIRGYDFFHALSIDYHMQTIFYGSSYKQRLFSGLYIYSNSTESFYHTAVPETNQVTIHSLQSTFVRNCVYAVHKLSVDSTELIFPFVSPGAN